MLRKTAVLTDFVKRQTFGALTNSSCVKIASCFLMYIKLFVPISIGTHIAVIKMHMQK